MQNTSTQPQQPQTPGPTRGMVNTSIVVDRAVLRQAQHRAIDRDLTISEVMRRALEKFATTGKI